MDRSVPESGFADAIMVSLLAALSQVTLRSWIAKVSKTLITL